MRELCQERRRVRRRESGREAALIVESALRSGDINLRGPSVKTARFRCDCEMAALAGGFK